MQQFSGLPVRNSPNSGDKVNDKVALLWCIFLTDSREGALSVHTDVSTCSPISFNPETETLYDLRNDQTRDSE